MLREIDEDGANVTTIEDITIADNGTNIFYTTVASTDIDNTTIDAKHLIIISQDVSDTPDYIKITIRGWYNADNN